MIKVYRPVGNSIELSRTAVERDLFYPFHYRLFQSGTAALAAAIIACIKSQNSTAGKPEVILPAYGCPDIVSAILYAGAEPVLVDTEVNSPFLSCKRVTQNITPRTIAIISANFLGLSGNISELRNICSDKHLFLIYDSAQWFPVQREHAWPADFNIVSFGRGKPISLLHGGAVITGDSDSFRALPVGAKANKGIVLDLVQTLKIKVYNLTIRPLIYRFVCRLPGLNVGKTLYKPLRNVQAMSPFYAELITHNVEKFRARTSIVQYLSAQISRISSPQLVDLVTAETDARPCHLLRYPILIKNKKIRDKFYEATRDCGCSLLYQKPLNKIDGLEQMFSGKALNSNAVDFANHLITLPCHNDIDKSIVDSITGKLKSLLNSDEG